MLRCSLFFGILIVLSACVSVQDNVKRPRETWVFRSNLDNQPRILNIALHQDLWVAYSTAQCAFFKAWKGEPGSDTAGMNKNSVFESGRRVYSTGITKAKVWHIRNHEEQYNPDVNFEGYEWHNNKVSLRYGLKTREGNIVSVSETPEYIQKGDKPGLYRHFKVEGLKNEQQLLLNINTGYIANFLNYSTNAGFIKHLKIKDHVKDKVAFKGLLKLQAGESHIKIFY